MEQEKWKDVGFVRRVLKSVAFLETMGKRKTRAAAGKLGTDFTLEPSQGKGARRLHGARRSRTRIR